MTDFSHSGFLKAKSPYQEKVIQLKNRTLKILLLLKFFLIVIIMLRLGRGYE